MKRRLEAKLRKAIRLGEHHGKGLPAAIRRRERSGLDIGSACRELVLDTEENRAHRMVIAKLLSGKLGDATRIWPALTKAAMGAEGVKLKADILRFGSNRTRIGRSELELLRCVVASGTLEEQITAIDGLAFVRCRPAPGLDKDR